MQRQMLLTFVCGHHLQAELQAVQLHVLTLLHSDVQQLACQLCTLHDVIQSHIIQRTGVDKIPAIRSWGGVGGANIKNPATPLAPQTRCTTEY